MSIEPSKSIINKANDILCKFGKDYHTAKDLVYLYDELDSLGMLIDTTSATRRELKDHDGYELFPCEIMYNGVVSEKYFAKWIVEENDFGNKYIIYIN